MSWMASLDQTCCQFQDFQGLDAQNSPVVFSHIGHVEDQWLCVETFSSVLPQCLSEERAGYWEIWKNSFGQNENFHTGQSSKLTSSSLSSLSLIGAYSAQAQLYASSYLSTKSYNNPEGINLILLRHERLRDFAHALTAQGGCQALDNSQAQVHALHC